MSASHQATQEEMRILDGIFNELIARMHANLSHRRACSANCRNCAELAEREQKARDAYDNELRVVFG